MIWYRHWIEMRRGLLVATAFVVDICPCFWLGMLGGTKGPARFLPWAAHTWVCAAAAVFFGLFLGGTGIRTNKFHPGHPSISYTLTLPISRFELIWTRFASACAAVYVLFAAILIIDSGVLLILGQPVPFGRMALSSFLAGLFAVAAMAVFQVLVPLWKENVPGFVYMTAIAVATHKRFIGSMDIPWLSIAAIFVVTGAALSAAAILARRQDF